MDLIVVGCGRAGALLASKMARAQHTVTVIDMEPESFLDLDNDFRGHLVQADALNRDVLVDAGVETADALASLTNSDAVNAVVGHVAKTVFHVPRVVVRSYDPVWIPVHAAFGHPTVSSIGWGTDRFAELLLEGSEPAVTALGDSGLVLAHVTVAAKCHGVALRDALGSFAGVVAAVVRDGQSTLPAATSVLATGDVLVVSATSAEAARFQSVLGAKEGPCSS
jgi:trk system potassium uptake protein TrkA